MFARASMGALASLLFQPSLGSDPPPPRHEVLVIVAVRELYPGVPIAPEDLYALEIPPEYLPDGVFLTPDHVVGRLPRERILANDLVRSDRLADPESGVGLNAVIPRGSRAISLEIGSTAGIAPGTLVDVLGPSSTVLGGAFVLGVHPDVLTLLVTAEQAERVVAASANAQLRYVPQKPPAERLDRPRGGRSHGVPADRMY